MEIYLLSDSTLFITIHAADLHLKVVPIHMFYIDLKFFTQTIKSKTLIMNLGKIKHKKKYHKHYYQTNGTSRKIKK